MNRRKFIAGCACCTCACAGIALYNKINLSDDNFIMNHVEVHIAEHCNLSCKYCCHFSSIAEKEFYDLDKFRQDIKQMSHVFNKQLMELPLLGGEPLLNPEINEYVKTARKYFPKTLITIITNATLLDDMDESFWKTLNENSTHIVPSIYPVKINWKSILEKAKKYNVAIYGNYKCEEKLALDNIDKFRKDFFYKMTLNIKGDNIDKSNCGKKFGCNSMYEGKLYPCFPVAYIRHLNKKFNTDFIVTENDYLDLYKIKSLDEIKSFLNSKNQLPFCKYCTLNAGEVKWENSQTHNISEWT